MSPQTARKKQTHSTGPRTDAGKAASSQNSLRHGLASGTLLIPGEDPAEFRALLTGLLNEWSPATQTERIHVENMARHQWLVERACRLQGELLAASDITALPPSFAVLLRYQTTNERAFIRAQKSLEEMQTSRREFVSQKAEADAIAFITRPFPPRDYAKEFETMRLNREAASPPAPKPSASPQGDRS